MSITNIDAEAFLATGEPAALISLVGIGSAEQSEHAARRALNSMKQLRGSDRLTLTCDEDTLCDFSPVSHWRRDPHEWRRLRMFLADEEGNVICLRHQDERSYVSYYESGCPTPTHQSENDDAFCAELFSEAISSGKLVNVNQKRAARLWNGRIFDSLEAIAKIRQMTKLGVSDFDDLVTFEREPLLSRSDVTLGMDLNISDIKTSEAIDSVPDPSVHYAGTFEYPSDHQLGYISEMKEMAAEIAGKRTPPLDPRSRSISIFISYDLEKRVFRNQAQEFKSVLTYISEKYEEITLVVNGLTSGVGGERDFAIDIHHAEIDITRKATEGLGNIHILDMFGYTLSEKLRIARDCHFYLAPKGNASLIPMLMDVPGIYFGSRKFMDQMQVFDFISNQSKRVSHDCVVEEDEDLAMRRVSFGADDGTRISYSLVAETLSKLTSRML